MLRLHPIFQRKPRHPSKMALVMGHERRAIRECDACDLQVKIIKWVSCLLKLRFEVPKQACALFIKWKYRHRSQQNIHGREVFRPSGRSVRAMCQFCHADRRHRQDIVRLYMHLQVELAAQYGDAMIAIEDSYSDTSGRVD
jgi:hypothetical protein